MPYPKLVAFEISGVLLKGSALREDIWGKGRDASTTLEDNVNQVDASEVNDQSNGDVAAMLCPDIPRIIHDVLSKGSTIALVSNQDDKRLTDRVLYYMQAKDASGNDASIISLVAYDEVSQEPKTDHFSRIQGWSQLPYEDMAYFTAASDDSLTSLGISVHPVDQGGLTWELYEGRTSSKPPPGDAYTLKIAHFNDVYNVGSQTLTIDGKEETINAMRFATLLNNVRKQWAADGAGEGVTVFSGDAFFPSSESNVTMGKHMAVVLNTLGVDVSVAGNHEFDQGFERLKPLVEMSSYPWLLSNIVDEDGKVPEPMKPFHIVERGGLRTGFIGLCDEDCAKNMNLAKYNLQLRDMVEVAKELSGKLRGELNCDLILAVTHCKAQNDLILTEKLYALAPSAPNYSSVAGEHGVDFILGGHDHFYWVSNTLLQSWNDYQGKGNPPVSGFNSDKGTGLVIKSGTDFQELSELVLTLQDAPPNSVRKKVIKSISGTRWLTRQGLEEDQAMKDALAKELEHIKQSGKYPIAYSEVDLDLFGDREKETPIGNWIADCLRPGYNGSEMLKDHGPVDCVIVCMGDIRGQGSFPAGPLTLENLQSMLAYPDPMVVLKMSGADLWKAMTQGIGQRYRGGFPSISGFRVEWSSKAKKIVGMWLCKDPKQAGGDPVLEEIRENDTTRKYNVMVGSYAAEGNDGYEVFSPQSVDRPPYILDDEAGCSKALLVRTFLLGAHYVNKIARDPDAKPTKDIQPETFNFIFDIREMLGIKQLDPSSVSLSLQPKKRPNAPNVTDAANPSSQAHPWTWDPVFGASPSNTGGGPTTQAPFFARVQDIPGYVPPGGLSAKEQALADARRNAPVIPAELQEMVAREGKWPPASPLHSFALRVAELEDTAMVDVYEVLRRMFAGQASIADLEKFRAAHEKDLPRIAPVVDGRLKDIDGEW